MMAGVLPIGIVIEKKARLYKIKHIAERSEYECNIPLPIKEWPQPARRLGYSKQTMSYFELQESVSHESDKILWQRKARGHVPSTS